MLFPSTMIGKKDGGFVLVTAILLLAVMVLVGTAVLTQTSIESKITGNLRSDRTAFFNAEAGVQYTLEKLKQDFGAGVLLPSGSSIALSYAAPAGFSCTLPTTLTALGSNRYRFQVSGNSPDGSTAAIEVELTTAAKSAFQQGLFGDLLVDLKSSSGVYSFDSRVTPHPNPADYPGASTNKADVGSNGEVRVYMDTYIDGSVMLGDNGAGTEAVLTST
ncbi:MAG: pilus assembly PilX N-terminal domain-containing protein, partial [Deltaproteobacteria bacterium]|nr:pilus assembly PilX N-terminal domain-containing protein [Deltaproteobacteria bacterium]